MANPGGYEYESNLRLVSADPGNTITIGTDDKLLVGGNGNGSSLTPGPGISIVGQLISALVSGDPGNAVLFGSDDGLYVTPGAAEPPEAGPGIEVTGDQVSAKLSADAGNAVQFGSDDGLFVTPGAIPDPLLISDGTQAAPSLAFASEPTLGIYRAGAGELVVTGELTAAGIVSINHAGNLAISASGSNNSNLQLSAGTGQDILIFAHAGVQYWHVAKQAPSAGGSFAIRRYNDAGAFQGTPLLISRTTGAITLESGLVLGISADADNQIVLGSDNRMFVAPPTAPDPTTFISADADNALVAGTDSLLFVPDPAAPTLVAGNGIAVAGLTISALLSADANNAAVFGSDNGLFVPDPAAPDPTTFISADADNTLVAGTDSLLFVPTPAPPTAASLISADADNQIAQGSDNLLFVPVATPPALTAGNGIGVAGDVISAALSADAGNVLVFGSDSGLFVPAPAAPDPASLISADAGNLVIQGTDNLLYVSDDIGIGSLTQSGSVTLAGTGTASSPLSATVVYSSDAGNIAAAGSDNGVFVPAPTPPAAASLISADADNQIVEGSDNQLFVAASAGGAVDAQPTASIDLSGDGTGGNPLTAAALLSSDANNVLVFGGDGALFAPGVQITGGTGITVTGDPVNGYTISLS